MPPPKFLYFLKLFLYFFLFLFFALITTVAIRIFSNQDLNGVQIWIDIHDIFIIFIIWRFTPILWSISLTQRFFLNSPSIPIRLLYIDVIVPFLAIVQVLSGMLHDQYFVGLDFQSPGVFAFSFFVSYTILFILINLTIRDIRKTNDLISGIPKILKEFSFIFLIITCAGVIGQLLGGCLWYLPILNSTYTWNRFGCNQITNENHLILIYLTISSILIVYTLGFYKKYIRPIAKWIDDNYYGWLNIFNSTQEYAWPKQIPKKSYG